MERCAQPRQSSGTASPDIPSTFQESFGTQRLSAPPPAFGVPWGTDDPVLVERRRRRRRAVVAGLIATALLGGGMASAMHSAPARPPTVQHQAGANR